MIAVLVVIGSSCKSRKSAQASTASSSETTNTHVVKDSVGTATVEVQQLVEETVVEIELSKPDSTGAQHVERTVKTTRRIATEAKEAQEAQVQIETTTNSTTEQTVEQRRSWINEWIIKIGLLLAIIFYGLFIGLIIYIARQWRRS